MDVRQIAMAVVNDRGTEGARAAARAAFLEGRSWDGSVHSLLPTVILEVKKPLYEGIPVAELLWPAAAEVLEWELERYREQLAEGV
jgi:hypothetical protein